MKYVLDMHCHTIASGHAHSTIDEYAEEAAQNGLELIAITDHGPEMPGSCDSIYFTSLRVIPAVIKGVEVLCGSEVNILNVGGDVDLSNGILKRLKLNIASIHTNILEPSGAEENTAAFVNAMKNPYIHVIGHPGDPRVPIIIEDLVSAARDTGTLIEINNASFDPNSYRAGGDEVIKGIALCCIKQGMPVVIGSDSHFHTNIGNFGYVEKMLDEINMPPELVLNTSKQAFLAALKNN